MRSILSFFALMLLNATSIAASPFKTISVAETNNTPAFINDGKWVIDQKDLSYLAKLKEYVISAGYKPKDSSEVDEVTAALKWVNSQWAHDGINQSPAEYNALDILKSVHKEKQKYRCVEFGIVLTELLQSYGYIARPLAMRSKDVAYGGFGQGHVAMEVWINDLNKWIFLDPQFGVFLAQKDSNVPLSYFEIFQQKKEGVWDQLRVVFASGKTDAKESQEYKNFLKNYFGHIKVSAGKTKPNICLLLEATDIPITFQGTPSNNTVFTQDPSLLYPEMNKVTLLLSYKENPNSFQKMITELNIKTDDEYLKNMARFVAKPNFLVRLTSSIAEVSGYEYRFERSGKWTFIKQPEFTWDATKANNFVEVRGINGLGRKGPITYMKIKYQ